MFKRLLAGAAVTLFALGAFAAPASAGGCVIHDMKCKTFTAVIHDM